MEASNQLADVRVLAAPGEVNTPPAFAGEVRLRTQRRVVRGGVALS